MKGRRRAAAAGGRGVGGSGGGGGQGSGGSSSGGPPSDGGNSSSGATPAGPPSDGGSGSGGARAEAEAAKTALSSVLKLAKDLSTAGFMLAFEEPVSSCAALVRMFATPQGAAKVVQGLVRAMRSGGAQAEAAPLVVFNLFNDPGFVSSGGPATVLAAHPSLIAALVLVASSGGLACGRAVAALAGLPTCGAAAARLVADAPDALRKLAWGIGLVTAHGVGHYTNSLDIVVRGAAALMCIAGVSHAHAERVAAADGAIGSLAYLVATFIGTCVSNASEALARIAAASPAFSDPGVLHRALAAHFAKRPSTLAALLQRAQAPRGLEGAAATMALAAIARSGGGLARLVAEAPGALAVLTSQAERASGETGGYAIVALGHIARAGPGLASRVAAEPGCLEAMVGALAQKNASSADKQDAAVWALGQVSTATAASIAAKPGALAALAEYVLTHKPSPAGAAAAGALVRAVHEGGEAVCVRAASMPRVVEALAAAVHPSGHLAAVLPDERDAGTSTAADLPVLTSLMSDGDGGDHRGSVRKRLRATAAVTLVELARTSKAAAGRVWHAAAAPLARAAAAASDPVGGEGAGGGGEGAGRGGKGGGAGHCSVGQAMKGTRCKAEARGKNGGDRAVATAAAKAAWEALAEISALEAEGRSADKEPSADAKANAQDTDAKTLSGKDDDTSLGDAQRSKARASKKRADEACAACGKVAADVGRGRLWRCAGCSAGAGPHYCSAECQRAHWTAAHRAECPGRRVRAAASAAADVGAGGSG